MKNDEVCDYWTRDEQFINDMLKPLTHMMATMVEATANRVLDNYLKTKGDSISRRQAEREFGKKWIADHVKTYGPAIYTQGVWNGVTGAMNNRMTFSRKQLAEIRAKETTTDALVQFSQLLFKRQREIKKKERKRYDALHNIAEPWEGCEQKD